MGEPSRKRLLEIAAKHKPRGWKLSATGIHPDKGDGFLTIAHANWGNKTITHPPIVDRSTLMVFLHECGHVYHKHDKDTDHHAVDIEWEAEQYAWRAMRAEGVAVPRWAAKSLRRYLRNIIEGMYDEDACHDPGYDKADVPPSDEIMRFVYGAGWRHPKASVE